jgi:hypothetical protein
MAIAFAIEGESRTVLTFMADQRVPLLIEAFHDAAPWCVALCETALSRDTA